MKRLTMILGIVALAAGCGSNQTDQDTLGTDTASLDGQVSDNGRDSVSADGQETDSASSCDDIGLGCLGGCPAMAAEMLSPGGGSGFCEHSPGVSGMPVSIPGGGWLIESAPTACCTDTEVSRLTWLKHDGSIDILREDEQNSMFPDQTLPALFAALPQGYVMTKTVCLEFGCWSATEGSMTSLDAYHYDGTSWWSLSAADLGNVPWVNLLDVADGEMWLLLSTFVTETSTYEHRLARITEGGSIAATWPVSVPGKLVASASDGNGFLLMTLSSSDNSSEKSATFHAVRVERTGVASTPSKVLDSRVKGSGASLNSNVWPMDRGIVVSTTAHNAENADSPDRSDRCVNVDGTIRWSHDGVWTDGNSFQPRIFHEYVDGSIGFIGEAGHDYWMMSADGQTRTLIAENAECPLGPRADWSIESIAVLDDGILVGAWAKVDDEHTQSFAAMYEPDFTALKWVRKYADDCQWGTIISEDTGWMFWCQTLTAWPECEMFDQDRSGTYLHFDSICGS